MHKDTDIILTPPEAADMGFVQRVAASRCGILASSVTGCKVLRRSIDSRRRDIRINLRVRVFSGEEPGEIWEPVAFPDVSFCPSAVVVGAGPAGLYAALTLIENRIRPVVLERGYDVHSRKRDCALLSAKGILNPESNYCYGEGGAGAFSDGKLFTRSIKRGDVRKVLTLFVQHGAKEDILNDSHPHIGTDVLPSVIENMRHTIEDSGGEVHFGAKVTGLLWKNGKVKGAVTADGKEYSGPVILATGHSAKDVYRFLEKDGVRMEAKATAVGVRLEHPQSLIDQMQYHSPGGRGLYLPPASYSFVTQVEGRGVYSFCMCPGGSIVPSATEEGMLSVNGMSSSSRSGKKANAAMVVEIRTDDIPGKGVFAMLEWVEDMERKAFLPLYRAHGQRMADFTKGKVSSTLPSTTYAPGVVSSSMDDVLPPIVSSSLRKGLLSFDRMSRGMFNTNEALLVAAETRTSAPVRIIRDDNFMASDGLFVCGEGAGYAGGIVSAAIDGTECAKRVASYVASLY